VIKTISLCPTCYKKLPADISFHNGSVIMLKECDVHGPFTSIVEKSPQHISNFYSRGTLGNNNTIIIHTHNDCNMHCPWCYYPMGVEKSRPFQYYNSILMHYRGTHRLLFSGGEPTLRPDFFEFTREAAEHGWEPSSITNMLKLADQAFFNRTMVMGPLFNTNGVYRFAMSMQHPINYPKEILDQKMKALENIEKAKLKAMCVMFSIRSLDELDWIREFYDHTKHCYIMIRIRTMFKNWANKGDKTNLFLSDLHKAFMEKFGDLMPIQSQVIEKSNMYCLYMQMDKGMHVSLSSAPTVENVDIMACSRPVFMLAMDGKPYPVPIAQIYNEGISNGWLNGFKLAGGSICG